jgi:hypothetical protein
MEITFGKLLSIAVAIAYVVGFIVYEIVADFPLPFGTVLAVCAVSLAPLPMIWFPEEIGNRTGWFGDDYVDQPSPAIAISIMGWFFLLGFPGVVCLICLWSS